MNHEVINQLELIKIRRHTMRCFLTNFINNNSRHRNWRIGDHVDKRLISQARDILNIDSHVVNIVNELEETIQPRHLLRCKLIKYIRDNSDSYPDDAVWGCIGNKINRRQHLLNRCLHRIGDFCDTQLITDSRNIFNAIGE